jgi:L-fuconolactonase
MRIDAHHHVWDLAVRDQEWTTGLPALRRTFTLDDLRPELAAARIDRTVLVQTVAVADETPEFLDLAAGAGADVIAGVIGWVDLTAPDVSDRLAALRERPGANQLVGIRHLVQSEPDARWLCRADVRRGLAAVAEAGLVYDLLVFPHQLAAAVETVRQLPSMSFVLDHLAKPPIASRELEPWRSDIRRLAAAPNVAVKLSGMVTEADPNDWQVADLRPYAETVLEAFGADRTMFGSDWPVCLLAGSYADVVAAAEQLIGELSAEERDAVFGRNAEAWYRLAIPA